MRSTRVCVLYPILVGWVAQALQFSEEVRVDSSRCSCSHFACPPARANAIAHLPLPPPCRSLNAPLMVPNGTMIDPLEIAEEELKQNKVRTAASHLAVPRVLL